MADIGSIVSSLLNGVLQPLKNASTGVAEQGRASYQAPQPNMDYKPAYMSNDEWQQYVQNPLGKNLQNVAGLASYVPIPGLQEAGILGSVGQGAASGLLGGIGSNDARQNLDFGNLIKDTVIGGVVGGGTGLLGKMLGGKPTTTTAETPTPESVSIGTSQPLGAQEGDILGKMNQATPEPPANALDVESRPVSQVIAQSTDPFNAQFEHISQNLTGDAQKNAIQDLINKIPANDEIGQGVIKSAKDIYGLEPTTVATPSVQNQGQEADMLGGMNKPTEINPTERAAQLEPNQPTQPPPTNPTGENLETTPQSNNFFDKAENKLNNFADNRELYVLRKSVGGNAPKALGGALLEKDFQDLAGEYGVKINSPTDAQNLINKVYADYGNKIDQSAQTLTDKGVAMNVDDLIKPLQDKIDSTKLASLQTPIQKVIDDIKASTNYQEGGVNSISPTDLLSLKRDLGEQGRWNAISATPDKSIAASYETAYKGANDLIDKTFQDNGISDFRANNKYIALAEKASDWVKDASSKIRPLASSNDMAQDIGLGASRMANNPFVAIPGFVAGKVLQSNGFENALAGTARTAANVAGGASDLLNGTSGLGEVVGNAASKVGDLANTATGGLAGKISPEVTTFIRSPAGQELLKKLPIILSTSMANQNNNQTPPPTETKGDILNSMNSQGGSSPINISTANPGTQTQSVSTAGANTQPASGTGKQFYSTNNSVYDPQGLALALMSAGATPQVAQQMATLFSPPPQASTTAKDGSTSSAPTASMFPTGSLSPSQTDTLAGYDSAQATLNNLAKTIKSNPNEFGTGKQQIGDILSGLNLDPGRKGIDTQLNTSAAMLAQALFSRSTPDAVQEVKDKYIPTFGDSPEAAQAKLDAANQALQTVRDSTVSSYKQYNNPFGFSMNAASNPTNTNNLNNSATQ